MINRREFLSSTSQAGLGLSAAVTATAGTLPLLFNEKVNAYGVAPEGKKKLRVGLIGCGWYGMVSLRHLIELEVKQGGAEVVALCDVDSNHLQQSVREVEGVQKSSPVTFKDYREMLKPKNLDVVLVATPDHWHALCGIAALEAGADLYIEKPLCHTYEEGVALVQAAKKNKRVVQVNMQRRSTPHLVKARELVQSGKLGTVGMVRAYCYYNMRGNDNPPDGPAPKNLDFDFWTGPAPLRAYNPLVHPKGWRKFMEYSNGILGDMGVHMLDVARWFLHLGLPRTISSTGGIYVLKGGKSNITDTQMVTYDYGDLVATWEHRTFGRADDPAWGWGVNFFGSKGTLQVALDRWEFQPAGFGGKSEKMHAEIKIDPAGKEEANVTPGGRAHMKNFLECVQTRQQPVSNIEEGLQSAALCLFGNISQKLNRSVTWDAKSGKFKDDEEANKLLRRDYRQPWTYPVTQS